MSTQVIIANDGAEITSTNYWQTEQAQKGLFFLSINAGCMRLLVPNTQLGMLRDMTENVREVVLTRGTLDGVADAVELMFEDGSDTPFYMHIGPAQADRMWTSQDEKRQWPFVIWTMTGKVASFDRCFLRRTSRLPYLKPWKG
jgi:hypothetical protein